MYKLLCYAVAKKNVCDCCEYSNIYKTAFIITHNFCININSVILNKEF